MAVAAAVILGSAAAIQQALTVRDRNRYPAPGLLVQSKDHKMHLLVRGPESGGLTVVLEAGMGSFSPNWYWVQRELAPTAEALRTIVRGLAGAGGAGSRAMHSRLRSSYTML